MGKGGFPGGTRGKKSACQCRRWKRHRFYPCWREDPLVEKMATHSSILAWKIPWAEEPGGLPSMWLQRVRHKKKKKELDMIDRPSTHMGKRLVKVRLEKGRPDRMRS